MKKSARMDYQDIVASMKEVDRIDDVIEERESEKKFFLPNDFDPAMDPDDEINISRLCEDIHGELSNRGFHVELDERTPLKAGYLFLQHVALLTEGLKLLESHNITFNGCGAWCEECFQRGWCSVREEIEKECDLEEQN